MTEPTSIPADSQWGVQWDVFVIPDGFAEAPPAPTLEDPNDEAQVAAYQQAYEDWQDASTAWEAALHEAQTHAENWQTTVYGAGDEATARYMLAVIRDGNLGNPQTKNFALVYAPPVTWTVVET